ncbi:hypothetical protein ULMS_23710 [Patiriisocius marinistellae]|uniref:DUF4177 domain-containing protein n=1 Tax=Patiriisocius marinistellae TaxID=2494560 RepID=A0A5J4FXU6_9FLAO|nr:DUF4177 domain-containing protein [Patiriisocius marinistellae]GEQ86863.1 hypothetical protein ULMS_23710 [Patiriisocius marinistellae]
MKEYKILKSEISWKDNIQNFEDLLNTHARQGWEVKDIDLIGGSASQFIALLEKQK